MIVVTGAETGTKYYLNPSMIASFHEEDEFTIIYMSKFALGKGKQYKVIESADDVATDCVVFTLGQ